MKTIKTTTGHVFYATEMPNAPVEDASSYRKIYALSLSTSPSTAVFFYVCTGYKDAPKEVHVFYGNGRMWSSYGLSIATAVEGAMRDAWLYTHPL